MPETVTVVTSPAESEGETTEPAAEAVEAAAEATEAAAEATEAAAVAATPEGGASDDLAMTVGVLVATVAAFGQRLDTIEGSQVTPAEVAQIAEIVAEEVAPPPEPEVIHVEPDEAPKTEAHPLFRPLWKRAK